MDLMVALKLQNQIPSKPFERAKITIIRNYYRFLDYDGLCGSMKPVVDAVVSCGIIKDDSWNVLGKWDVDQVFRAKADGPLIEVIVQEIPSHN